MKSLSLTLGCVLAIGLTACRWGNAPAPSADASATPVPVTMAAAPVSTAPGNAAAPAEAAPAAKATRPAHVGHGEWAPEPAAPAPAPAAQAQAPAVEPPQARTAAAAPARPARQPIVIPAGTELTIALSEAIASDKSQAEQRVDAELTEDVREGGRVVLPAGSEVRGHVAVAQRSGRVKGRARLVLDFDEIRAGGRTYRIEAERWDVTAASSRDRDAKIAGGAAAAGAIIGAITGGGKGALKGGVIGGVAGGAAILVTRGNEVELRPRVPHRITLRQGLRIE